MTARFRLTIDLTVETNGEPPEYSKRRLADVARNVFDRGEVTGDGPATIESWTDELVQIVVP